MNDKSGKRKNYLASLRPRTKATKYSYGRCCKCRKFGRRVLGNKFCVGCNE